MGDSAGILSPLWSDQFFEDVHALTVGYRQVPVVRLRDADAKQFARG
ncbi:MAG: hypothetical protein ACXVHB_22095 [Solirubrobacteraceae bacterium]